MDGSTVGGGIDLGKRTIILIICIFLLSLAGCSQAETFEETDAEQKIVVTKEELAISIPDEVKTLDPLKVENSWEMQIVSNIYEGLVGYNSDSKKVEPVLAKEWTIASDGLTYTFKLRDQAIFHSGKKVTATDVKASWERAIKYSSAASWHVFNNVVGFEQFVKGGKDNVSGINALSDEVLEVKLISPDETFLNKLTHPAAFIVNVEYINNSPSGYGLAGTVEQPTLVDGTGPFAMVEWVAHQNITLEYFNEHPAQSKFKRVDFRLAPDVEIGYADLKRGYVDILRTDTKLPSLILPKEPIIKEKFAEQTKAEILYLGFNVRKGPLQNQALRQAISFALDREMLGEGLNVNTETQGLLPRLLVQNRRSTTGYVFSQASARQLIDDISEQSTKQLDLSLYYVDEGDNQTLVERIANSLNEIGIKVTPKSLNTYQELVNGVKNGVISFYLDKWTAQSEEAGFFLTPFFQSKSPYNHIGYSNELVDELLNSIQRQKPFSKEYIDSVLQLEELIMSDVPVITLFEVKDLLISSKLVNDAAFHPLLGVQPLKVRLYTEINL